MQNYHRAYWRISRLFIENLWRHRNIFIHIFVKWYDAALLSPIMPSPCQTLRLRLSYSEWNGPIDNYAKALLASRRSFFIIGKYSSSLYVVNVDILIQSINDKARSSNWKQLFDFNKVSENHHIWNIKYFGLNNIFPARKHFNHFSYKYEHNARCLWKAFMALIS